MGSEAQVPPPSVETWTKPKSQLGSMSYHVQNERAALVLPVRSTVRRKVASISSALPPNHSLLPLCGVLTRVILSGRLMRRALKVPVPAQRSACSRRSAVGPAASSSLGVVTARFWPSQPSEYLPQALISVG